MRKTKKLFILLFACVSMTSRAQDETTIHITDGLTSTVLKGKMEQNAMSVLNALQVGVLENRKQPKIDDSVITKEGKNAILEVWKNSPFYCTRSEINEICVSMPAGSYQIRDIPVRLVNAEDEEKALQDLVITFNAQGMVENISFAIDANRYRQLIAEADSNQVYDMKRRQIVLDFVENFRTAYNRKDIKTLNQVFSDKALIITGHVVKAKTTKTDLGTTYGIDHVEYKTQSKQQYLTNLARVFKNNKFVDVKFEDIEIVQHPMYDDIYGVNLIQYYNSSRYSDTGYLFLMIDFTDENEPCIQVRVWQPEKPVKEGTEEPYTIADIKVNK